MRKIIKKLTFLIPALFINLYSIMGAKPISLDRIEPSSWWIGFENPVVQVMIYGNKISATRPEINYPGVTIKSILAVENPNYLFLDLVIDKNAKPGVIEILFKQSGKIKAKTNFELLERYKDSAKREGFNQTDAIYLIMPDRFANGDPNNDMIPGMKEKPDRNEPYGRHGGDLAGIRKNLDYIKDLGFSAIWLNPVLENDQPQASYHGYAITDFYKIDRRLGTNKEFKELVNECRSKNIKMIMDMVFNHCGSEHWWMKDLPAKDWIHQYPGFTRSNYRLSTVSDPYASKADLDLTTKGWFDTTMPDMNLQNNLVLNYLIQNSIWWIEFAGLQGIRMDTYPYPDKTAMAKWVTRIMLEYPKFNIVGESWISNTAKLAYWQKDFPNSDGYNSNLKTLMDFPLADAMAKAFNEDEGWSSGLIRLYDVLADDHLYRYPMDLVIFAENHDLGRMFHFYNNDVKKMKLAIAFLATVRGIPQWYYGSEILMDGNGYKSHADIRKDFPGGWPGDKVNAFTEKGRTQTQNEVFNYLKTLLNYRLKSHVLHHGKTLHFIPQDGVYVYFRYIDNNAVMVLLNNNDDDYKKVDLLRFSEILSGFSTGTDIVSGQKLNNLKTIKIPAKSALVIELK